jgi:hypothetical protein
MAAPLLFRLHDRDRTSPAALPIAARGILAAVKSWIEQTGIALQARIGIWWPLLMGRRAPWGRSGCLMEDPAARGRAGGVFLVRLITEWVHF